MNVRLFSLPLILTGFIAVCLVVGLATVQAQDSYAENFSDMGSGITQGNDLNQQQIQPAQVYQHGFSLSETPHAGATSVPDGAGEAKKDDADKKKEDEKKKKKKLEELNKQVASAYKTLFFDNDFSYLCDESYDEFHLGDRLKKNYLPRGGCYDIGGQYRARAQFESNMFGLGLTGVDDDFVLQRTRIYGDFHFTPRIRVYAEMLDADNNYGNFGPRPIDVNRTEMQNLFIDASIFNGGSYGSLTARVGRQELLYGAQRVVSPLDWANTRRTFEGALFKWKKNDLSIDGFWTNPVRIDDHSFDSPDRDQEFMGIWSTYKGRKDQTTDVYWLRYLNGRGANNFKFDTIGLRNKGERCGLLWELQAAAQFGKNTDGSDHSAGMLTTGVGRKFDQFCWKPNVWLYYDWASGDQDLGAGNGYDQLFPLAHKYLGFMDLFGRRNIEDANLLVTAQPTKRLKLLAWYHYFFLATQSDSPYTVIMTPFNGGNLPGSVDLGHEIDFTASYTISPRQNFLFGYSHFFSGRYYDTTPGVPFNGNANFFYTQYSVNF